MLGYADLKTNDFLGNYFGISFYIDRKFSCKNTSFATTALGVFVMLGLIKLFMFTVDFIEDRREGKK